MAAVRAARQLGGDGRRLLERRRRRLSRRLRLPIELSWVDDAGMTELNARHRGQTKPTDVLSFAPPPPIPGQAEAIAGSVAINVDAVVRQAPGTDRWSWSLEASSLLVHGAAHLAGHDHATTPQARAMLRLETKLARRLGLSWLPRPYGRGGPDRGGPR